jgi:DNA replication protein DnaC
MKDFKGDVFFRNFEKLGKSMYGEHYILNVNEAALLMKLKAYFGRNEEEAIKQDIDLSKGILLTGAIGVGKTSLMHIFRASLTRHWRYLIKPCAEISYEYIQNGPTIIFDYSRNSFNIKHNARTICFDDLGLEPQASFFGNKANIMREIILARYYYYQSDNMLTHFTTNLGATQIEERYGIEVRSRLREMCNFISFSMDSVDKRK